MHRRALRRADAFKQAHAADDDGGEDAGGTETYAFLPQVWPSRACCAAAAEVQLSIGHLLKSCPTHGLRAADCHVCARRNS